MRRTAVRTSGTLYQLDEIREENEARRKQSLRKHRVFKLVEVVACILGLLWMALLLGALLRHGGK
jgi:hypothetical protein